MPEIDSNRTIFKATIATPDLPGLGPAPRASRKTASAVNRLVDQFILQTASPENIKDCLRSAALLWHDHLDASHEISQRIHTPDGSFLHAMMHRREPDFGNAKYWLHRVGMHSAFPDIAEGVTRMLEARNERNLLQKLVPRGCWDPAVFVDECEQAARRPDRIPTLQAVQEIEFDGLLAHLFSISGLDV